MIIFGWGHKTISKFGPVRKISCGNCNNETSWQLQKLTSWCTLFFLPVIPYRFDHLIVCPVCRCCLELDKTEFERLKELIKKPSNTMSKEDAIITDSIVKEAGGVIRTETQINFIRQMKEIQANKEKNQLSK
ncbi:UNVERIFIED_CONTAM: zinc ribbon family protein [Acetivibrio alkalicellulosi]